MYVTLLQILWVFTIAMFEPIAYGEYVFPPWANAIGWFLALFSMLMIPGTILFKLCKAEGSLAEVKLVTSNYAYCKSFMANTISM